MAVCGRLFYASYLSSNTIAVKKPGSDPSNLRQDKDHVFGGEGLEGGSEVPGWEMCFAGSLPETLALVEKPLGARTGIVDGCLSRMTNAE